MTYLFYLIGFVISVCLVLLIIGIQNPDHPSHTEIIVVARTLESTYILKYTVGIYTNNPAVDPLLINMHVLAGSGCPAAAGGRRPKLVY